MIVSKSTKSTATGIVPTYLQFIKKKTICTSLIVLSVLWTTTVFNYFMVQFILYQYKENENKATLITSASDFIGFILGGLLLNRLGPKLLFMTSNALACVLSCVMILMYFMDVQGWPVPVLAFMTEIGTALSLITLWLIHASMFPVHFSATAFGIINFVARF